MYDSMRYKESLSDNIVLFIIIVYEIQSISLSDSILLHYIINDIIIFILHYIALFIITVYSICYRYITLHH